MLWLGLYLPDLPLEVVVRGGSLPGPLAIAESGARLIACNGAARRQGLHPGMGVNAARVLAPHLVVRERDARAEAAALERLAAWAGHLTSRVSLVSEGREGAGLLLEVGGSLRLFGGLRPLRGKALAGLADLGYRARNALAPTPLAAWWLARAGREAVVTDPDALPRHLSPLPLRAMGLPQARAEALAGLGVRTLGEVLALPRAGLARRLGEDLPALLDRALGQAPDPRPIYRSPPRFQARQGLPAPVDDSEALAFAARRLLLELAGFLLARGRGAEALTLHLFHHRPPATRITLTLSTPSRDAEHLLFLLRQRLERVTLDDPVLEVGLTAERLTPLESRPGDLFATGHGDHGLGDGGDDDWQRLVERLTARLGSEAVHGLCIRADHRPERAHARCAPGERTAIASHGHRPLWLLPSPRPIAQQGGLPHLNGPLTLRQGPERIETGWWDGQEIARDYYVAEHPSGERLWVYRERSRNGGWFLHGLFG
jgi:protein ImuB